MARETVKVFRDVTDHELKTLLSRIKKWDSQMESYSVEVEEYHHSSIELMERRREWPRRSASKRFSPLRSKPLHKVIWRYVLKTS